MSKVKKLFISVLSVLLIGAQSVAFASCGNKTADSGSEKKTSVTEENGAPLGIYTDLQFVLNGENGTVTASVKNKFTLFPSTVTVNLELYRSQKYEDNVSAMTLVASNYIYDLDQGETLSVTASTEGRQSFWKARARYKIDNKPWQERLSETVLFDKDGNKTELPDTIPDDREYYISDFLQDYTKTVAFIRVAPPQDKKDYWYTGAHGTFFESEEELNVIKDLFGEIKLDRHNEPFAKEQLSQGVLFSYSLLPFRIQTTLDDGTNIHLYIDDLQEIWDFNLFVEYYNEDKKPFIYKYFTATVSDEMKQALIDYTTSLFWDANNKKN